eukprot:1274212-Rhodomonas_salina.1
MVPPGAFLRVAVSAQPPVGIVCAFQMEGCRSVRPIVVDVLPASLIPLHTNNTSQHQPACTKAAEKQAHSPHIRSNHAPPGGSGSPTPRRRTCSSAAG